MPHDAKTTVVLLRGDLEVTRWMLDTGGHAPDLAVVDLIARLHLAARRVGCSIRLTGASRDVAELLELAGLNAASVEVRRQPEGGEEVGVEEVVVPDDSTA